MAGERKKGQRDERLERLGRALVRTSASDETEARKAAGSPFLYARVRARIEEERVRREEGEGWLAVVGVVWRAVPALALVAVLAFALLLSASSGARTQSGFSDDALIVGGDSGQEEVVFTDTRAISSDDVLAAIINDEGREDSR
jgi:hypothetical protein